MSSVDLIPQSTEIIKSNPCSLAKSIPIFEIPYHINELMITNEYQWIIEELNNKYNNKILAFVCAIFGLFSPFFITMIGATWTDNLTPILILFGLSIYFLMVCLPQGPFGP